MRVVFDWCEAQGFRSGVNPTQNLTKVLPKPRRVQTHHAALAYPQLPAFIMALHEADASEVVKLAFRVHDLVRHADVGDVERDFSGDRPRDTDLDDPRFPHEAGRGPSCASLAALR